MVSIKRHCSKCKKILPLDCFYKNGKGTGYRSACKECRKRNRQYAKDYWKIPLRRFKIYERDALKRKLEFKITFKEFIEYWQKPCYYCGSEISTIGLDRKDNSKGYVVGNIVPCCIICNRMKSALSESFFIEQCKKIGRVKI